MFQMYYGLKESKLVIILKNTYHRRDSRLYLEVIDTFVTVA